VLQQACRKLWQQRRRRKVSQMYLRQQQEQQEQQQQAAPGLGGLKSDCVQVVWLVMHLQLGRHLHCTGAGSVRERRGTRPVALAQAPVLANVSSGLGQLHGPCRQLDPALGSARGSGCAAVLSAVAMLELTARME
jgi:hypothetical protein